MFNYIDLVFNSYTVHLSFEIKDFLGLTINLVCSVCVDNNLSAYRVLDILASLPGKDKN